MTLKHPKGPQPPAEDLSVAPIFTLEATRVPRHHLAEGEMDPDVAYQIVHDELMLDGNARLNLATFVTTWMEPAGRRCSWRRRFDKNMIDKDEYPQTAEIEMRCVDMLSRLWHAPEPDKATGCSTTGSSEAAMLGGLALKRRWQQRARGRGQAGRQAQPRDGHQRPGLLGEVRQLLGRRDAPGADGGRPLPPLRRGGGQAAATRTRSAWSRSSGRRSTAATSRSRRSARRSTTSQERTGLDIPIHVDGASGGFIAPFLDPDLEWDFRVPRVAVDQRLGPQVRAGLPGRRLGRLARRRGAARGPDLLGQLPGRRDADLRAQLLAARLAGGRPVLQLPAPRVRRLPARAAVRARRGHAPRARDREARPVRAAHARRRAAGVRLQGEGRGRRTSPSSTSRRRCASAAGRCRPTRSPKNREDLAALRVVVRRGFTLDVADLLLDDLKRQLPRLEKLPAPGPGRPGQQLPPLAAQLRRLRSARLGRGRVARLVEAELDPAGKGDGRQQPHPWSLTGRATSIPSAWRVATVAATSSVIR